MKTVSDFHPSPTAKLAQRRAEKRHPSGNQQRTLQQGPWTAYAACVRGPSHERQGMSCQDAFDFAVVKDTLIAVVCDGAGSARRAESGARLCSHTMVEYLQQSCLTIPLKAEDQQLRITLEAAIEAARLVVASQPEFTGRLRDYHATVVGVIADRTKGVFFHIGDGFAAGLNSARDWQTIAYSPPENGEYVNETFFFTEERWRDHLRLVDIIACDHLMLMTDGVATFLAPGRSNTINPIFAADVTYVLFGNDPELAAGTLTRVLKDPRAQRRSQDDKTLVIARRH